MTVDWITPDTEQPARPLQIAPKQDPQSSHERVLSLMDTLRERRIERPFDTALMELETGLHSIHFAQCEEAGT